MGEFNAVVGVNSVGNEDIMGNLDMTPEIKEMRALFQILQWDNELVVTNTILNTED